MFKRPDETPCVAVTDIARDIRARPDDGPAFALPVLGEAASRAAITAAAAPYRRDDGSHRFENVFRYVIGRPAGRPTPAAT